MCLDDFSPGGDAVCPVVFDCSVGPAAGAVEDVYVVSDIEVCSWSGVVPGWECVEGVESLGKLVEAVGELVFSPVGVVVSLGGAGVFHDASGVGGIAAEDVADSGFDSGEQVDGSASRWEASRCLVRLRRNCGQCCRHSRSHR